MAICIQFFVAILVGRYLNAFLSLAFGYAMFSLAIADDMIQELRNISETAKALKNESQMNILKRLTEIVAMHADMKQLKQNMFH